MKQETNTAATTLEQVNAMPAATWGWLKMNQTKLELSDELVIAPAEAVEVEGLDEQYAGTADAFDAAMDAMAERFPERRAAAPGDAADRARITPETELDVPATSVYQAGAIRLEEELSPAEAFETGMGEAAYTYLAEHATKRIVIDVPVYKHATVTVRVSGVDAAAPRGARWRDRVWPRRPPSPPSTSSPARRQRSTCRSPWTPPLPARASWAPCCACAPTSTPPST